MCDVNAEPSDFTYLSIIDQSEQKNLLVFCCLLFFSSDFCSNGFTVKTRLVHYKSFLTHNGDFLEQVRFLALIVHRQVRLVRFENMEK